MQPAAILHVARGQACSPPEVRGTAPQGTDSWRGCTYLLLMKMFMN